MGGALCRRCDNYLGSGRWRCFSKVRCLSAASSDFWKTLLATFQSLSSFHRRSLSRPYASSSASVKPRNPATPKEKRPHMQPLTHITIETISNPTSDHPEIIRADNPPVSLKLKPLIMKLRLIISSLKLPQKHNRQPSHHPSGNKASPPQYQPIPQHHMQKSYDSHGRSGSAHQESYSS